ncbi:hypothetical protein ANO11243_031660 [Dothideomycetidae sp. 11243]|nr:hypothetical protein ANO11243_031660 [fungal sp. No.11243]
MKTFAAVAALAGLTFAAPQAVTSAIAPSASAPAGCSKSYSGTFELFVVKQSKKRSTSQTLEITLSNGVLTDALGRTGYIAANNQFQFDGPVQAGAIYTAGWSACSNGSLALGGSTVFYECLSGTFYNLYDDNEAAQCSPIQLEILGSGTAASGAASVQPDGQITATPHTVLCQITDGQIQQNTCYTSATAIAEQTDGQITGSPVAQITDGQIQAPTGSPVAEQTDGQITGAPVTQITDGQPQAPTTGAVVTQASDAQIGAPTNGTAVTSATLTKAGASATYTGAAQMPTIKAELMGLAAGLLALAAL